MSEANNPDDEIEPNEPHDEATSLDASIRRVDSAHPIAASKSASQENPIDLPKMDGPPLGMRRAADDGSELIDAMAGRASLFGFGFQAHLDALLAASERYLGDGVSLEPATSSDDQNDALLAQLREYLDGSIHLDLASIAVCTSPEMAIEKAIELARTTQPTSRFRTIALRGSDHGRSGVCRTASGRPELHEGYGPMMAGFCHVPAEDIDAIRRRIDDQTAAVLLSPVDLQDAARPLTADYLTAVRELCDEHELLLIIDESRLCLGSAATPFVYSSIAEIKADAVVVAGGLFAGLPGAILLANERLGEQAVVDTDHYPLIRDVAVETLAAISRKNVLQSVSEIMTDFAVEIAECIGQFEFIRDVHATGMTIGIETDIQSGELVRAASRHGIRIEAAGETSIRIQPPLVISDHDRQELVKRVAATMDEFRRDFADLVSS